MYDYAIYILITDFWTVGKNLKMVKRKQNPLPFNVQAVGKNIKYIKEGNHKSERKLRCMLYTLITD